MISKHMFNNSSSTFAHYKLDYFDQTCLRKLSPNPFCYITSKHGAVLNLAGLIQLLDHRSERKETILKMHATFKYKLLV